MTTAAVSFFFRTFLSLFSFCSPLHFSLYVLLKRCFKKSTPSVLFLYLSLLELQVLLSFTILFQCSRQTQRTHLACKCAACYVKRDGDNHALKTCAESAKAMSRPSSLAPTPASGTISCEAQQLSYAMENRNEDGIDLRLKTHGSSATNTQHDDTTTL